MRRYDRTESMDAMWELQRQGFHGATTHIRTYQNETEVWLYCDMKDDGSYPDIEIDCVEYWADPQGRIPHMTGVCNEAEHFWWVFD